ncbi:MAG: phosphate/phosphite/phosphonate ABC transporter substrate-binding protein [Betaproteobacteria bacterium]
MKFRSWVVFLVTLSAVLLHPAEAAESSGPFRIGIAPHTSARVIVEMYQPLRLFLEKSLDRPVEIVTASDFTEFARRGLQQQYDLAVTTGHQARLFETDAGYSPLLTYQTEFRAVILVGANSRYKEPKDLSNTTVIGLSPSSLVTIWGQHWLHRNEVTDFTIRYVSASDSVAQLVINSSGSAGMTSLANYENLQPAVRDKLRILSESLPLAGRVYLLNKRHAAVKDKINSALWAFAETPEAQQYFKKYKLDGYRKLGARELVEMTPYANEVRQALKTNK